MLWRRILTGLGLGLGLASIAQADTRFNCEGKLTYLALDASGTVNIAIDGVSPIHGVCNILANESYRVAPEMCKAMYATFLAVKMSERTLRVYYEDPVLTTCSQIAAWSKQRSFYYVAPQ